MRQVLTALASVPAYIIGRRLDVLAWNELAQLLIADFPALPADERNMARLVFLDETARDLYRDWEIKARDTVANPRAMTPAAIPTIPNWPDSSENSPWPAAISGVCGPATMCTRKPAAANDSTTLASANSRSTTSPCAPPDDPDMAMMIYSAAAESEAAASLNCSPHSPTPHLIWPTTTH
jgi:hypothetical protein